MGGSSRLKGFTSLLAVAVLAVPFGSLGALAQKIMSGEIVKSVSQGRFIVCRYDDNGRVSYRVAALKQDPSTRPLVVVLGGSAVRECITSDEGLRRAIRKHEDTPIDTGVLASSVQTLAGALAIIDNLPAGRGGVVVIGVHHLTFAGTALQLRQQLTGLPLLMTSKALHDFAVGRFGGSQPNSMTSGLRARLAWYQSQRGVPAFTGTERPYWQHRYFVSLSVAAKRAMMTKFLSNMGAPGGPFFTSFDLDAALLRRCTETARLKGYQVLLMEDPQDAAVVGHTYDTYKARYRPVCLALARQGAHYVNANLSAGLVDGDFFDISHLLTTGRAKWTPCIGAAVAQILRDHRLASARLSLSNDEPLQNEIETVTATAIDKTGHRLPGAEVTFVWHFPDGDVTTKASTDLKGGAAARVDIGATPVYAGVVVDVTVTYAGRSVTKSVPFSIGSTVSATASPRPSPTPTGRVPEAVSE